MKNTIYDLKKNTILKTLFTDKKYFEERMVTAHVLQKVL